MPFYELLNQIFKQKINREDFLKIPMNLFTVAVTPFILSDCDLTDDPAQAQRNVIIFYSRQFCSVPEEVAPEMEALIRKMYSSEECLIVQHLFLIFGRTGKKIADHSNTGYSVDEIENILKDLADRFLVFSYSYDEPATKDRHPYYGEEVSDYTFDNHKSSVRYSLLPPWLMGHGR